MSKLAFLSSGTGIAASGAAVVGVVTLGAYVGGLFEPNPPRDAPAAIVAAEPAQVDAPAVEPVIETAVDTDKAEPEPKVVASEPAGQAPSFDVVRVETSGAAMIAGRAEAGSSVAIRVDDEVIAEVEADSSGNFASFVDLPKSEDAQVLTLDVEGGASSEDQVIVMPAPKTADAKVETNVEPAPVKSAPVEVASATQALETPETDEPTFVENVVKEVAEQAADVSEVVTAGALAEVNEAAPENSPEIAPETTVQKIEEPAQDAPQLVAEAKVESISKEAAPEAVQDTVEVVEETDQVVTEQRRDAVVDAVAKATVEIASAPDVSAAAPKVITELKQASKEVATLVEETPQIEPELPVAKVQTATPVAPTVLIASEQGVRVLQSANATKPEALTSLLGAISYDDSGEVALTGNAGGDFVRVYLNNRPIAVSQIAANGDWQAGLPSVDTGVYTLRVDELNEAGDVVARVETPFKREDPEVLAAASNSDKPLEAITVQPGATLWAIARDRYGSGTLYARVFEANSDTIKDPDLIYPGQVFRIPD